MGRPTNPDTLFTIGTGQGGAVITPIWAEPSTVDIVLNQVSAAQTVTFNSANLAVSQYHELLVGVNITAVTGTSPTMTVAVQVLGADGVTWFPVWTSASQTATGQVITSIGAGMAQNQSFADTIRVLYTIGGTTPSFTFSAFIKGKQAV